MFWIKINYASLKVFIYYFAYKIGLFITMLILCLLNVFLLLVKFVLLYNIEYYCLNIVKFIIL